MPSHPSLAQTVFPCCTRRVRTLTCLFFNLVAAACLGPGLSLPLLTVIVKVGDVELLRQSRSTLGTVRFLRSEGALLPAVAIALFSVFVPIFKFLVLMIIAVAPSMTWRRHMYLFVRNWSKWSMADVFMTAVWVAFLSANAAPATMAGRLEPGWYWFLAYCVFSLVALQCMPKPQMSVEEEAEAEGAELTRTPQHKAQEAEEQKGGVDGGVDVEAALAAPSIPVSPDYSMLKSREGSANGLESHAKGHAAPARPSPSSRDAAAEV